MSRQPNIGDLVYVPCRVVGKCLRAYSTDHHIIDVRPIESTSGETYAQDVIPMFSVDEDDVVVLPEGAQR